MLDLISHFELMYILASNWMQQLINTYLRFKIRISEIENTKL